MNKFRDIFSIRNRMLQKTNLAVKRHKKEKWRAQYLITNKEVYNEVNNDSHSLTLNEALRKLKRMKI